MHCRIPNFKCKSLSNIALSGRSHAVPIRNWGPVFLVCGAWLCVAQNVDPQFAQTIHGLLRKAWISLCCAKCGSKVCADNPWIAAQSVHLHLAQGNPRIVPIQHCLPTSSSCFTSEEKSNTQNRTDGSLQLVAMTRNWTAWYFGPSKLRLFRRATRVWISVKEA